MGFRAAGSHTARHCERVCVLHHRSLPAFAGSNSASDLLDIQIAFDFLRGMATLALAEDGYVVEGHGGCWVHWIKGEKLIVIRGFRNPDPDEWWIPFLNQNTTHSAEPDVSQEEMNALARRLSKASGWEWREGLPKDDTNNETPTLGQDVPLPAYDPRNIDLD